MLKHFCEHPDYQCFELCIWEVAISSSLSCIFSGALICSFIWSIFFFCLSKKNITVCYVVSGLASGICRETHVAVLWRCMWGRCLEGKMSFAQLSDGFQLLPLPPISKLGPSGADSWVVGFVHVLGHCGSLQWTLLWGWEFLLPPQPPQVFSFRGFEALFPCSGTLGYAVCLAPQLFLLVYPHTDVGLPAPPATALPGPPAVTLPWVLSILAAHLHLANQSGWMFLL